MDQLDETSLTPFEKVLLGHMRSNKTAIDDLSTWVGTMQEYINNNNISNSQLRQENARLRTKVDDLEYRVRERNLIIIGLEEQPNEDSDSIALSLCDLIVGRLGVGCTTADLDQVRRLGKPRADGKDRPVLAEFITKRVKYAIVNSAKKLKGTCYYIRNDTSEQFRQDRKVLYEYQQGMKSIGKVVKMVKNKLLVDGELYTADELETLDPSTFERGAVGPQPTKPSYTIDVEKQRLAQARWQKIFNQMNHTPGKKRKAEEQLQKKLEGGLPRTSAS
uniref:Uncharacterized protein n=1 Tax=Lygus hesperus TaxID=30085 RepID=A0A0A9ZCM9_LYGHE